MNALHPDARPMRFDLLKCTTCRHSDIRSNELHCALANCHISAARAEAAPCGPLASFYEEFRPCP